jgi:hypothetical protein
MSIILISVLIAAAIIVYKSKKEDAKNNIKDINCPDYWEDVSEGNGSNCVNVKNLGTCGSNAMDFTTQQWVGDKGLCNKNEWAKKCDLTWDGITNNPNIKCVSGKNVFQPPQPNEFKLPTNPIASAPITSAASLNNYEMIGAINDYCRGIGNTVPAGSASGQGKIQKNGSIHTLESCAKTCDDNQQNCTGFDFMDDGSCVNWNISAKNLYEPQRGVVSNRGCWVKKSLQKQASAPVPAPPKSEDKYFMFGPWIASNKEFKPVSRTEKVGNNTIYMFQDGIHTKMVDNNATAKYYEGNISAFDGNKWNTYNDAQGNYMLRQCPSTCSNGCSSSKVCSTSP